MLRLSFLLSTLLFLAQAQSADRNLLPADTKLGTYVQDLSSGKVLEAERNHAYFPPASTLKVLTALAAQHYLGRDYVYQTTLEQSRRDYIIRFSGDPTLTTNDLEKLIQELKDQGTNRIAGSIWLDDSIFSGYERAVGIPWDVTGNCYGAPSSAITLDHNCLSGALYRNEDNTTRVNIPMHFHAQADTSAIYMEKEQREEAMCDLELTVKNDNYYHISGCHSYEADPLPLHFAIYDTRKYTQQVILDLLDKYEITLQGDIRVGKKDRGKLVAKHESSTLRQMLQVILYNSNNLYADNITKTLGHRYFNQAGNFRNGTQAIINILKDMGITLDNPMLADGSGLSRSNRIKLKDMAQVLHYIWEHDKELRLLDIMPIAGKKGSLKHRLSMQEDPIKGRVVAKSGAIYSTYNMVGFFTDEKGKPEKLFVQYITNYLFDNKDELERIELPLSKFEQSFYGDYLEDPDKEKDKKR